MDPFVYYAGSEVSRDPRNRPEDEIAAGSNCSVEMLGKLPQDVRTRRVFQLPRVGLDRRSCSYRYREAHLCERAPLRRADGHWAAMLASMGSSDWALTPQLRIARRLPGAVAWGPHSQSGAQARQCDCLRFLPPRGSRTLQGIKAE